MLYFLEITYGHTTDLFQHGGRAKNARARINTSIAATVKSGLLERATSSWNREPGENTGKRLLRYSWPKRSTGNRVSAHSTVDTHTVCDAEILIIFEISWLGAFGALKYDKFDIRRCVGGNRGNSNINSNINININSGNRGKNRHHYVKSGFLLCIGRIIFV